jgi:hypothetical protein
MRDYPKGVLRVYDSGPKCFDRYCVYFTHKVQPANPGMYALLGMSDRPTHPQGFGQHSEGQLGRHNGKLINFSDLPAECQACVMRDLQAS